MFRNHVRTLSLISFAIAAYWAFHFYREASLPMNYVSTARMSVLTDSGEAVAEIQQRRVLTWAVSDGMRLRAFQRMADQDKGLVPPAVELGGQIEPAGDILFHSESTDRTKTRVILDCLLDEIRESSADVSETTLNPFNNQLTFRIRDRASAVVGDQRTVALPLVIKCSPFFLAGVVLLFVSYRLPRRPPPLPQG